MVSIGLQSVQCASGRAEILKTQCQRQIRQNATRLNIWKKEKTRQHYRRMGNPFRQQPVEAVIIILAISAKRVFRTATIWGSICAFIQTKGRSNANSAECAFVKLAASRIMLLASTAVPFPLFVTIARRSFPSKSDFACTCESIRARNHTNANTALRGFHEADK